MEVPSTFKAVLVVFFPNISLTHTAFLGDDSSIDWYLKSFVESKVPIGKVFEDFQLAIKKVEGVGKTGKKQCARTVDGRNPAPPGMYKTLKIMG